MNWHNESERQVVIRDFSAGIDQSGSWETAAPGAVFQGKNCTLERTALSTVSAPQKQTGMALTGVQTLLVHYAQNASGEPTGTLVAATQNDLLCWRNGSWQSIRGQLTLTGGQYSALNYRMGEQDVLIAGNGSDDLLCWPGTGNVQKLYYQDGTHHAPRGAALALHRERLWVGGVADARQSVFYSDDMNPASWITGTDAAGEIQVQTWDGDAVTALAMLLDDIVIFKRRTAFRVVGAYPGEYEKVQVYATQGAIAPKTVCAWHDRALFLSDDGILQYDGLRAQPLLPGRVQDILKRVNLAAVSSACAAVWRNRYFLALPLDGAQQNNAVLEYDLVQQSFMLRTLIVCSFVVW
nr:hypothetical protein [Eubacteriales bacterium]